MTTALFVAVVAIILTAIIGLFGYLVKRSVFERLDSMESEMRDVEHSKTGVDLCLQVHKAVNQNLEEIKKSLEKSADTLHQVSIDVAVLKNRP